MQLSLELGVSRKSSVVDHGQSPFTCIETPSKPVSLESAVVFLWVKQPLTGSGIHQYQVRLQLSLKLDHEALPFKTFLVNLNNSSVHSQTSLQVLLHLSRIRPTAGSPSTAINWLGADHMFHLHSRLRSGFARKLASPKGCPQSSCDSTKHSN